MAKSQKESLDWWKKPEHLESGKKPKKRREGASKVEHKTMTHTQFLVLLAINCSVIGVLCLLMLVGAHYLLISTTRHDVRTEVPQFTTLNIDVAKKMAESRDLNLVINDSLYAPAYARGEVLDQLPKSGSVVKPGRTIYVTINAMNQKMVDVPYVAGRSLRQARNMLEIAGLTIARLDYRRDMATNYILAQYLDGKEVTSKSELVAPLGSGVTLAVGVAERDDHAVVPLVIGQSFVAAKSMLLSMGLNVGSVVEDVDIDQTNIKLARVYAQEIDAESEVNMGADVNLSITLDGDRVKRSLKALEDARMEVRAMELFDEELEALESELLDSLSLYGGIEIEPEVPEEVEEMPRQSAEKVDFEDLFN